MQIKDGFLWLKENSETDSIIIGYGIEPYAVYYAERQYIALGNDNSSLNNMSKADYLVMHVFVPHPPYINEYLNNNQKLWNPVFVSYFDKEKKSPAIIIFKKT